MIFSTIFFPTAILLTPVRVGLFHDRQRSVDSIRFGRPAHDTQSGRRNQPHEIGRRPVIFASCRETQQGCISIRADPVLQAGPKCSPARPISAGTGFRIILPDANGIFGPGGISAGAFGKPAPGQIQILIISILLIIVKKPTRCDLH